ncbi:helix-turn-helix domain-containing protein [Nocardia sp. X0981]
MCGAAYFHVLVPFNDALRSKSASAVPVGVRRWSWRIPVGPGTSLLRACARLTRADRIEIADGRARGERVEDIAERIGKSYETVYREIARNNKPDATYQLGRRRFDTPADGGDHRGVLVRSRTRARQPSGEPRHLALGHRQPLCPCV